jgi:xanthine dehydrogenase YagT iron-sulfur-binding subunit
MRCAISSISPVRRKDARWASVAPAPCGLDGRRVVSCLVLAARLEGRRVTTIEGLSSGATLHPLQAAFIERDAFQCGYCTPGQIMSGAACIDEGHAGSSDEIREWMSGNLCRCGAYNNIVAAIEDARDAAART